jgi:hypothetical protein
MNDTSNPCSRLREKKRERKKEQQTPMILKTLKKH